MLEKSCLAGCCACPVLALGGLTNPGAASAKENKNRIVAPLAPVRGVAMGMQRILKV